jgi:cyclic pyranopterin phosphate synthase
MKKIDEAQATVKKDKEGKYYDLSKDSPLLSGRKTLNNKEMKELIKYVRPRFMITPRCNAWCVFCSNEGSSYATKKQQPMNLDLIFKLSEMAIEEIGTKAIDFSGGEPLLHPDFIQKKYELLKWTNKYPKVRFAIHTNGIELTKENVDAIKTANISRLGISVHSVNFDTWNKITNRNNFFTVKDQKRKFEKLMSNLDYLSKQDIGDRIMMKSIVMRGVNDSKKELSDFLKATKKFNFHPRFIQYEPMYKSDRKNVVGRKELFDKLVSLGCKLDKETPFHNSPDEYIPLVNFEYDGSKLGLHGLIECGTKGACLSCYKYIVAFIKPTEDGQGLFLKPCSVLNTSFDITKIVKSKDSAQLYDVLKLSREYLLMAPGLGCEDWNKEE